MELSRLSDVVATDPIPSAASTTGYRNGLRRLLLSEHPDACQWIMQAQAQAAGAGWRIHRVDYDNAPWGREVHWSMLHRLWLLATGCLIHIVGNTSLGAAVEQAAIYSGPLSYALFGAFLAWIVTRGCSPVSGGVVCLGLLGLTPLRDVFAPGEADHHGLIVASVMLTLLPLHLGLRMIPSTVGETPARMNDSARRWLLLSGLSGGIGLWLSAASVLPLLGGVGLGAGLATLGLRQTCAREAQAAAWRLWGRVGGLTSLAGYLIEYFPDPLPLRLEVNHPLYALAWAGATELLALWLERSDTTLAANGARAARWMLAAVAVLALPIVLAATHRASFWLTDPLLWRLHREYISEFQSLPRALASVQSAAPLACALIPLACLAGVGRDLLRRATPAPVRQRLIVLTLPTLIAALMAATQARWLGQLCAVNLCLLVAWLVDAPASPKPVLRWKLLFACGLLLPALLQAAATLAESPPQVTRQDLHRLAGRSLAYRMKQRIGDDHSAIVLTSPIMTNTFAYFGGLRGLGTLYWENRPGLHRAAAIYAAPTPQEAERLIREAGVTSLVVVSWDGFEPQYVRLARGLDRGDPISTDAFIMDLIDRRNVPAWLQPVPYRLPAHPAYEGQRVWIFDVVAPRPPDLILVDEVEYLLESGDHAAAWRHESALRRFGSSVPAKVTLARLLDSPPISGDILNQIERLLPQNPDLRIEDRIRLCFLAAQSGRMELARRQLELASARLDPGAVRKLSPETLAMLQKLSDRLPLSLPEPGLRDLIRSLMPPYLQ